MDSLITAATAHQFIIKAPDTFKSKAFEWAKSKTPFCFLDSNNYQEDPYSKYDCLIAAGQIDALKINLPATEHPFLLLRQFFEAKKDWLFGYLGYDLKNAIENLDSSNMDGLGMPDLYFFQPAHVISLKENTALIQSHTLPAATIFEEIQQTSEAAIVSSGNGNLSLVQSRFSRQEYIDTIKTLQKHIGEGDIYEINMCQEFFAEDIQLDPFHTFRTLNQLSQAPFSAFLNLGEACLLCSSPERFLQKTGNQLISQPIKGTIKRGKTPEEDEALKKQLKGSPKDQAENVMIVDLVRNDLGKTCLPGTVEAKELFGIYPFNHVFQMISTVTGELKPDCSAFDAIRNAFPMGSMTGAPKVRSMELIEQYERTKRGLYSGAVGYFTPSGDFDFNVVIRSILYNAANQYLSFQAGGAVVFDSIPEKEYEETLLKARALREVVASS